MLLPDVLPGAFTACFFWAFALALLTVSVRRLRNRPEPLNLPLFTAGTACTFAISLLSVPAAGIDAGLTPHAGLFPALLLGPYGGCLAMSLSLLARSLLLDGGGFLALGLAITCYGFIPCFLIYPFCYKPLLGFAPTLPRLILTVFISALLASQTAGLLTASAAGLSSSGNFEPLTFGLLLQPLCLNAGLLEGGITALPALGLFKFRPDLLQLAPPPARAPHGTAAVLFALALLITGISSLPGLTVQSATPASRPGPATYSAASTATADQSDQTKSGTVPDPSPLSTPAAQSAAIPAPAPRTGLTPAVPDIPARPTSAPPRSDALTWAAGFAGGLPASPAYGPHQAAARFQSATSGLISRAAGAAFWNSFGTPLLRRLGLAFCILVCCAWLCGWGIVRGKKECGERKNF